MLILQSQQLAIHSYHPVFRSRRVFEPLIEYPEDFVGHVVDARDRIQEIRNISFPLTRLPVFRTRQRLEVRYVVSDR